MARGTRDRANEIIPHILLLVVLSCVIADLIRFFVYLSHL